ncbi:MAG: phospho-sugar mutase [Planctomycetaceae bacterium]|nr:phospho-sugar mutase [Planctomycetaceae bacterium]
MNTIPNPLAQLDAATMAKKLSARAAANIRTWLTEPYLADYAPQVVEHIESGQWQALEEAFWTTIPFGTGGRRGRMYPIGCNAINDRTIGESAQGLADYVRQQTADDRRRDPQRVLSCVIAYDTRHRSRHFAELCAEIMAAARFRVYFHDGYRSTPQLSFAVRHQHADCGIMVTASHNPPSDNAVKVYGPSGGQYVPPHDHDSIAAMQSVTWIRRVPFAEALTVGQIVYCQEETDAAFLKAVLTQSVAGPRNLKILYSPLHGVGTTAAFPTLVEAGFQNVEIFKPHAAPDGDFPNVPNHVANPENPAVFDAMIERARQSGAELILATDPDCDRLGCAIRASLASDAPWATLTGNQLGSLLTDFLLGMRQAAGTLTPQHYVVKTLVTTELIRRIADRYGAATFGNLHVGFKWIGAEIDARGPKHFVFGAEESYGFLAGDHARDKDAAAASLLTAELTARLKAQGKTLFQRLNELFVEHGCFTEGQVNVQMPGEKGMDDMQALMAQLRTNPPERLGGQRVVQLRDYFRQKTSDLGDDGRWTDKPLDAPRGDMVILRLQSPGNYVAVRPSGTEPKVKIYLFAYDPPHGADRLEETKRQQAERLKSIADDFRSYSGA